MITVIKPVIIIVSKTEWKNEPKMSEEEATKLQTNFTELEIIG